MSDNMEDKEDVPVGQIFEKLLKIHRKLYGKRTEKYQINTQHYIWIKWVKLSKTQDKNRRTTSKTRE